MVMRLMCMYEYVYVHVSCTWVYSSVYMSVCVGVIYTCMCSCVCLFDHVITCVCFLCFNLETDHSAVFSNCRSAPPPPCLFMLIKTPYTPKPESIPLNP